jgi:hypothetical protein
VVLISLAFTVLPTADIENVWLFEAKLLGGFAILLGVGYWIFDKSRSRRSA